MSCIGPEKSGGVLTADQIRHMEIKKKVAVEYAGWVRKVLEFKLNDRNAIRRVNVLGVSLLKNSAAFLHSPGWQCIMHFNQNVMSAAPTY